MFSNPAPPPTSTSFTNFPSTRTRRISTPTSSPSPGTPQQSPSRPRTYPSTYPDLAEGGLGGGVSEWGFGGYKKELRPSLSWPAPEDESEESAVTAGSRSNRRDSGFRRESGNSTRSAESHAPLIARAPPGAEVIERPRAAKKMKKEPVMVPSEARTPPSYRKHRSLWGGLLTLLIAGYSAFTLFEAIYGIASKGDWGRGVVRWIEVTISLVSTGGCMIIIVWLQTRRPSNLSFISVFLALIINIAQIIYALVNLILVLVWRRDLKLRCSWSIDAAWVLGKAGKVCGTANGGGGIGILGWVLAASLRLLLTIVIALLWIYSLRSFHRALSTSLDIPPPMTEAQTLLPSQPTSNPDHLPSMPDRASHYAFVSDDSTTLNPAADHLSPPRSPNPNEDGVGGWLASSVMGAVGWMLGVTPYEESIHAKSSEDHEEVRPRGRFRNRVDENRIPEDEEWEIVDTFALSGRGASGTEMRESGPGVGAIRDSDLGLATVPEHPSPPRPRSNIPNFQSVSDSPFAPPPPPPGTSTPEFVSETTTAPLHRPPRSATGSSGSTNGALVFVRMSDGRLVRKLSTIASEVSDRESSSVSTSFASDHMLNMYTSRGGEVRDLPDEVGRWRANFGADERAT